MPLCMTGCGYRDHITCFGEWKTALKWANTFRYKIERLRIKTLWGFEDQPLQRLRQCMKRIMFLLANPYGRVQKGSYPVGMIAVDMRQHNLCHIFDLDAQFCQLRLNH